MLIKSDPAAPSAPDAPLTRPDDLRRMPGHMIRRLNQLSHAIFTEQMRRGALDLTSVQYAAMIVLNHHPGIDQANLAEMIAFDRATIGGVVRRLEKKGLIERQLDENDRRARQLHLTEAGRAMLVQMDPRVRLVQDNILERLDETEHRLFLGLMRKMIGPDG
ncbi:MAG: MarR family transcriptional regulator [Paracoccus sp. (in: a-proteobacteria)]|nr:MarR family transcriptional regulator [Paracoccus sp. (in: a-proteobacteria)]